MSTANTFLGFDYGRKRIGIAVGQDITCSANPVTTLNAKNGKPDWASINQLIKEWEPQALVVGLPLNLDGSEHTITKAAQRFGNQLHGRYNLPVHMVDERLTSVEAKHWVSRQGASFQKDDIDKYAAKLILEAWLNNAIRK